MQKHRFLLKSKYETGFTSQLPRGLRKNGTSECIIPIYVAIVIHVDFVWMLHRTAQELYALDNQRFATYPAFDDSHGSDWLHYDWLFGRKTTNGVQFAKMHVSCNVHCLPRFHEI